MEQPATLAEVLTSLAPVFISVILFLRLCVLHKCDMTWRTYVLNALRAISIVVVIGLCMKGIYWLMVWMYLS